jgi:UDP-2,4-diacetamido-2,4,6-trideoxy-beta-L-altropyranose hydrolase
MNVAIRVDASRETGTGHFFRCLTLADALKANDVEPHFICRHLLPHLQETLQARGHALSLLPAGAGTPIDDLPHSPWLGVGQAEDASATSAALGERRWDWLVADHYALDVRWESALRGRAARLMAIDDLADRPHDCDLLLDQNLYADMAVRYAGKLPEHCCTLLGPQFALLRGEFRTARAASRPRTGAVSRILVLFGGVDPANYTGRSIAALAAAGLRDLAVDVVIGQGHPFREQIEAACSAHAFELHVQTARIAELMAAADLSVGAGGSAVWERCCVGLPTLVFCTAANQERQIGDAAARGLLYAPEISGDWTAAFTRHLGALRENPRLLVLMSRNGMGAVDGQGVARVLGAMGYGGIEVREARAEDSRSIFEWRNHISVRERSRDPRPLDWAEHDSWFKSVLGSDKRIVLVGSARGQAVGVVRFDIDEQTAEVSIYLRPDVPRATGRGRALLAAAESWISTHRSRVAHVHAFVLGGNEASRRLFESSGYRVESSSFVKRLQPT